MWAEDKREKQKEEVEREKEEIKIDKRQRRREHSCVCHINSYNLLAVYFHLIIM